MKPCTLVLPFVVALAGCPGPGGSPAAVSTLPKRGQDCGKVAVSQQEEPIDPPGDVAFIFTAPKAAEQATVWLYFVDTTSRCLVSAIEVPELALPAWQAKIGSAGTGTYTGPRPQPGPGGEPGDQWLQYFVGNAVELRNLPQVQ